ncbi:hypothetical protein [Streptomyces albogriseolus]|uniref:hypothetical protein n=1 Tax=Streptomyces albogriseolus TaxID=1887 RepID=UPI00345FFC43
MSDEQQYDDVRPAAMAVVLPHRNRLKKALVALDAEVAERQPGQPANPMGERGDAAQMLGMLAALVEQMQTPLRGGPLHKDMQKGYLSGYGREVPAIFAQLGDRLRFDEAFVRHGVEQVPHASQQLSMAAAALGAAGKALVAAALVAEGLETMTEEKAAAVQKLTLQAAEYADLLTGYVAEKRKLWHGEGA